MSYISAIICLILSPQHELSKENYFFKVSEHSLQYFFNCFMASFKMLSTWSEN